MFNKILNWFKGKFISNELEIKNTNQEDSSSSYTEEDLNKMTKGKLVDLAKNDFDLVLDIKMKKTDLISAILNR